MAKKTSMKAQADALVDHFIKTAFEWHVEEKRYPMVSLEEYKNNAGIKRQMAFLHKKTMDVLRGLKSKHP